MIWLPCTHHPLSADKELVITEPSFETIDPYPYLGEDKPFAGLGTSDITRFATETCAAGWRGHIRSGEGYRIVIIFRDAFLKDGSSLNRSVLASAGRSGVTVPFHWRSPIVAALEAVRRAYLDITFGDFRDFIDYFISYRMAEVREVESRAESDIVELLLSLPMSILSVKICCYGEVRLLSPKPVRLGQGTEATSPPDRYRARLEDFAYRESHMGLGSARLAGRQQC